MSRERRLGRGLEALLGKPLDGSYEPHDAGHHESAPLEQHHESTGQQDPGPLWVGIYEIDRNPYQPRSTFDEAEIQSLAESLADHGMIQPVVVRRAGERYQLISGERRWRAATVAGWEKVPCHVWDVDDQRMAELALVENVQRKDLNPLEKAASFQRYIQQYGCTQEEVASRVKIDRSTVANLIRLLDLPEAVQDALRSGKITAGHARALLPLGEEREQIDFCERIQREGISVRATEELVQTLIREADHEPLAVLSSSGKSARPLKTRSEHLASLEQEFRTALGTKVDLRQGSRGHGRIVIHFRTNQEFERLRDLLAGGSETRISQAG